MVFVVRSGPDGPQKVFSPDRAPPVLDQRDQHIGGFWRKRQPLALAKEQPAADVQPEGAKLEQTTGGHREERLQNFIRKRAVFAEDFHARALLSCEQGGTDMVPSWNRTRGFRFGIIFSVAVAAVSFVAASRAGNSDESGERARGERPEKYLFVSAGDQARRSPHFLAVGGFGT